MQRARLDISNEIPIFRSLNQISKEFKLKKWMKGTGSESVRNWFDCLVQFAKVNRPVETGSKREPSRDEPDRQNNQTD